ncbi:putative PEP-binding protein [Actinokineospora diospyrosa]|uniref:Phosphotransferase system, enzyme I, PtsI n=1 Tax=Actinokineospora diospyrosa TaxID=103728 RepID=A0ABT1I9U9_9PSEU|nr:putative PEP-binding protein [Actinokineospora diospyrosa]MCP2269362.1 phosphotransferase system, enzyme I, PtsI [Actinokineospora diospyrosa]
MTLATPERTDPISGSATIAAKTVVRPDLPFAATAFHGTAPADHDGPIVLVAPELTFHITGAALRDPRVRGVVVGSSRIADHARKMLQEGRVALVTCHEPLARIADGDRLQVDAEGIVDLGALSVPVTAICSTMTRANVELYRSWNVTDIGYFRLKFCLFELLAGDRSAYGDPAAVEAHLSATLVALAEHGWRRIRVVLSDPTSAELRELGVEVPVEDNPELGVRGPRAPGRWAVEVRAIEHVVTRFPDTEFQVSVPFVSTVAEFDVVSAMFADAGVLDRIGLGITLEVPAMVYALSDLLAERRPAFIGIGTSDLFALINGVDRNHPELAVDPFSAVNRSVVAQIRRVAAEHGTPVFVCGEVRKDPETARSLVETGCGELIASTSVLELAAMSRAAAI